MFYSANSAQNSAFRGLWVYSLKTSDKVLKYCENNKVDFSEHPTVVKRGSVRTINIYAAVPDVAQDKPIAHWNLASTYGTI